MNRYILTGPATKDIDEVLDYIAAQSAQSAITVAKRFDEAFARIAETPGIGHTRPELKDRDARVVFVSGYVVIFDPILTPVHILRVIRGPRDLGRISTRG